MIVILEGVDATGKTTLARELLDVLGDDATYLHAGPPREHPLVAYVAELRTLEGRSVVCDRWHVGERVWPTVFDRPTEYDDACHAFVESFLLSRGAFLVACVGPPNHVRARLVERGDAALRPDQVPAAIRAFRFEFATTRLPKVYHAVEAPVGPHAVRVLAEMEAARSAEVLEVTGEYVGPTRPEVLLVGDRINRGPRRLPRMGLPLVPFPGTSGAYLWRAVARLPFDVGVTNACVGDRPDGLHLGDLHDALGRPRVVALGNEARAALEETGVRHGATRHPQYVRRFLHRRLEDYASSIVRAAADGADTREELTWRK